MSLKTRFQSIKATLLSTGWMVRMLAAVTVLFGVFYIWQVNVSATQGYTLRDLDRDISELEHDIDRLELEVSRLRSVDSVTTRVQMLGLTTVEDVNYINLADTAVAVNR